MAIGLIQPSFREPSQQEMYLSDAAKDLSLEYLWAISFSEALYRVCIVFRLNSMKQDLIVIGK